MGDVNYKQYCFFVSYTNKVVFYFTSELNVVQLLCDPSDLGVGEIPNFQENDDGHEAVRFL